MKKIIIDYLNDHDYEQPAYKSAKKNFSDAQVIQCSNYEAFIQKFKALELNQNTIITFMAHSHPRGLNKGSGDTLITWAELIDALSSAKRNHIVILNLLAVCSSYNIEPWLSFCRHNINEFWLSKSVVESISKSLLAANSLSFETFHDNLEEEDQSLYKKI